MLDARLEAVAESLGLEPMPEDVDSLRKRIRTEIGQLHPDRNEGEFVDEESRERFQELSNALVAMDTDPGSALVPLSSVGPMVSAIMEAIHPAPREDARERTAEIRRREIRNEAREEARHRFRLPRLGSGAIAALVTGLGLLPVLVEASGSPAVSGALEASFIAPIFADPLFEPLSFGVAVYAWLFFGLTWFMEQNDLQRIDRILTEEFRRRLVRSAVLSARQRGDIESVTRSDMRSAVDRQLRPAFILRLLGARDVAPSFLDRVVEFHAAELVGQGVLKPAGTAELSPRYTLAPELAEQIQP